MKKKVETPKAKKGKPVKVAIKKIAPVLTKTKPKNKTMSEEIEKQDGEVQTASELSQATEETQDSTVTTQDESSTDAPQGDASEESQDLKKSDDATQGDAPEGDAPVATVPVQPVVEPHWSDLFAQQTAEQSDLAMQQHLQSLLGK